MECAACWRRSATRSSARSGDDSAPRSAPSPLSSASELIALYPFLILHLSGQFKDEFLIIFSKDRVKIKTIDHKQDKTSAFRAQYGRLLTGQVITVHGSFINVELTAAH